MVPARVAAACGSARRGQGRGGGATQIGHAPRTLRSVFWQSKGGSVSGLYKLSRRRNRSLRALALLNSAVSVGLLAGCAPWRPDPRAMPTPQSSPYALPAVSPYCPHADLDTSGHDARGASDATTVKAPSLTRPSLHYRRLRIPAAPCAVLAHALHQPRSPCAPSHRVPAELVAANQRHKDAERARHSRTGPRSPEHAPLPGPLARLPWPARVPSAPSTMRATALSEPPRCTRRNVQPSMFTS